MFTLSAFADEISPDPAEQVAVLKSCNVRHIEFRSIHGVNVLKLDDVRLREFASLLDGEGMKLSAIGSPIGKIRIDEPFEPHFDLFKRACEIAKQFRTLNVRVFSYYPPERGEFPRGEVIRRMAAKAEYAAAHGLTLFHENEHRIYGDSPERVLDLIASVNSPALRACYDAANYVVCGHDPKRAWEMTRDVTGHFHIKDWKTGGTQGVLAGSGDGQISCSIYDAVKHGYSGFATLEPHLRGGGPTGGFTGPDLFSTAVEAFRQILRLCNGKENHV